MNATLIMVLALSASCAGGASSSRASPPQPTLTAGQRSYTVVNATGPFFDFWKTASDDPAKASAGFKTTVVAAHPELFDRAVIGVDPTKKESDLDERLPGYLASLPSRMPTMRRLAQGASSDLDRYDASFRQAFPDMAWSGTVYFTVSVDAFDGAVRSVGTTPAVLFGIDKIALVHGPNANLEPLFHHELFHVYHSSVNPWADGKEDGDAHGLLEPLWFEGLAVYVTRKLDPSASLDDIVLSQAMVDGVQAALPKLCSEFLALLDDATEAQYRDYFLGKGQRTDIPKRAGYFLGYLVAEEIGKTQDLRSLAHSRRSTVRAEVEKALKVISARGSKP